MNRYFSILSCLLFCASLTAQSKSDHNWQVSLNSKDLIQPGLGLLYEHNVKNWTKEKANKQKKKFKSVNLGTALHYSYKFRSHHSVMLGPNFNYRSQKENGKFTQWNYQMGYIKTFLDGDVFEVSNNIVQQLQWQGQHGFYNSLTFGFGKDLRVKRNIPFRYAFNFGVTGRYPINKSFVPGSLFNFQIHHFIHHE